MKMNEKPKVITFNDYDGYFTSLVNSWINRKPGKFKHREIRVSAGPYRMDAVSYVSKKDVLELDFYSPLRVGLGLLSSQDISEIIELL